MTTSPIQSNSPVSQTQQLQAAAPAKSSPKQVSALPQDTVTLSAAGRTQQPPPVAKDSTPTAGNRPPVSGDGDHDGH
jgi:hypothetical protein